MKPYYEDEFVQIYHGDAREILPSLPKVDLVLTDPLYGVGLNSFDDNFAVSPEGLKLAPADLAVVFMSPRRVVEFANAVNPPWNFERVLWMEKSADISFPWRGWLMNSEAIMVFSKPDAKWSTPEVYSRDCYRVGPWGKNGHPNAKPPSVVADIIMKMSAQTILDPFMGSGTTLRAAKDLGRKAVGVEIEERYCEIAAKRCNEAQPSMYHLIEAKERQGALIDG